MRVGISGITGCGKSTFSNDLAKELETLHRKTVRISIDAFHNPKNVRYQRGRSSALGYYEDAHNYGAFQNDFLRPLGGTEPFLYSPSSLHLEDDRPYLGPKVPVSKETIFVVDGTFLFKPKLLPYWDYKIFLSTDFEIAESRGAMRDSEKLGGIDQARSVYKERYHAACALYLDESNPKQSADTIVANNDFHARHILN